MRYTKIIAVFLCCFSLSCKSKKENIPLQTTVALPVNTSLETIGLNLGNKAPDINGKNYNDSLIHLISLKGKMVLIDFWASWCGPCRLENPNVVKTYWSYKEKKFKNGNGFTVLGVSLDEKKEPWKAAIIRDNLAWENHISDLKGWNSDIALKYNITGIPYNYLINGDGIIVAINLRTEALPKTLDKFLSE